MAENLKIGNLIFNNVDNISAKNTSNASIIFGLGGSGGGGLISISKTAQGTYTAPTGENTFTKDISINVGFKPKIFFLGMSDGMKNSSSSIYLIVSAIIIADDNYSILYNEIFGAYHDSSTGARTAHSVSEANTFYLTENGVHGGSGSTFFVEQGRTMSWHAWG